MWAGENEYFEYQPVSLRFKTDLVTHNDPGGEVGKYIYTWS